MMINKGGIKDQPLCLQATQSFRHKNILFSIKCTVTLNIRL